MADDNSKDKRSKLANTRKRFKELQELKRQKESSISPISIIERSLISPSSPANHQINYENNTQLQETYTTLPNPQNFDPNQLSQYENLHTDAYNGSLGLHESPIASTNTSLPLYFEVPNSADFFDSVASTTAQLPQDVQENVPKDGSAFLTHFNTNEQENSNENTDQNIGLAKYFDNRLPNFEDVPSNQFHLEKLANANYALFPLERKENYVFEMQHITHPTNIPDSLTEEDPVVNADIQPKNLPDIFDSQGGTQKLIDYLESESAQESQDISTSENNQAITNSSITVDYPEIGDLKQNPSTSTQNLPDCYLNQETLGQSESDKIKDQISKSTDLAKHEAAQHSNVESLRQLSDHLAHMIDASFEFSASGGITDLEKRNLELAANLEKEKLHSEQLRSQNQEYLLRINDLELRLRQQETGSELQNQHEVSRLKDELQTHFQTIGLLVAEKTELATAVNQYELNLKQKNSECEELQARLKASRSRVADLERELGNLREEKSKIESLGGQYSSSYEVIKKEYESLRDQKEELAQDLLEAKERLRQALDENLVIQQEKKDLAGKISLADIKIQQLTSSSDLSGVNSQIEQLTQQKFALETDLTSSNQMLKTFIKERDEARTEYQHYTEQLNAQIANLHTTVEKLQQEKENLIMQEQNRIRHIGELERQLQTLQDNQLSYVTRSSSNGDLKTELENYKEMVIQMESQKTAMEETYTKVFNEKELLLKELEAKTDSIAQLEHMVEQLRGNQPDSVKLLATMESDKVAAARAVQQNRELKLQMESMQEVFAKLDNDKITLTEQLNYEQNTNKELMEKLQKTEIHLQTLADAIEIKDKELLHIRNNFEDINRQALHHEQLADRLRHYEAHDHSANSLQNELLESKTTIAKLTNELNAHGHSANSLQNELLESKTTIAKLTNELHQLRNIQGNWDIKSSESESESQTIGSEKEKNTTVELTNEINRLKAELSNQIENNLAQTETNLKKLRINENVEDTASSLLQNDANQNTLNKETTVKFLEEKVKRTMEEIADLTDEKQRLEHIILQLQGETETIGEYVALYQHQRMILKQKALEKDYQLKQLASDRELIKGKLDRLNQLIKKLVTEKGVIPEELIQHQESINNQANNLCELHSQMNDEVNSRIANKEKDNTTFDKDNIETKDESKASSTAEEIINLLSEIKSSNLVEPEDIFHHCPYCSGQLITV